MRINDILDLNSSREKLSNQSYENTANRQPLLRHSRADLVRSTASASDVACHSSAWSASRDESRRDCAGNSGDDSGSTGNVSRDHKCGCPRGDCSRHLADSRHDTGHLGNVTGHHHHNGYVARHHHRDHDNRRFSISQRITDRRPRA
ncbi:MAG: hypothetical protein V7609_2388 [Verrucomicrobiota bacterium]